ncbi:dihydroorotase [Candidatus Sumerlaeota bacterium]
MAHTLLIKNGRVIDPANNLDAVADVLIEGKKIKQVGPGLAAELEPTVDRTIDATDMLVVPGLIDPHVHLREPGQEDKETIATGTRAAAAGGFTSIVAMPNTHPVVDSVADIDLIRSLAWRSSLVWVYSAAAVTVRSEGELMTEMGDLVAAGAVAFTDDGLPVMNSEIMRRALEYASMFDKPVLDHCEDSNLVGAGVINEGQVSAVLGLAAIPAAAESCMVARDIELAEHTGGHVHVMHVSAARSVDLIRQAKARGVRVTAEVTPHHLSLTDEALREFDTNAKMSPPLRSDADRAALREALADGTIDCIGTDHAPHTDMEKDLPFVDAPNGVIGLETAFAVCYSKLVEAGELELPALIERMTLAPARVMGFDKGTLSPGGDADVAIIDLALEREVSDETFFSKSRNSAFLGQTLRGWPVYTIFHGRLVYAEGQIIEKEQN